jgi:glycosyltransferase involved in cell wall biosynthesis
MPTRMDKPPLSTVITVDDATPLQGTVDSALEWVHVVTGASVEAPHHRRGQPSPRVIRVQTKSRSEARNAGLMAARGEVAVFLTDRAQVADFVRSASDFGALGVECAALAVPAASWRPGRSTTWSQADGDWIELTTALMAGRPTIAYDVHALRAIGGFNSLLGPGTTARGAGEFDVLVRLIRAGHSVSTQPAAGTRATHRPSDSRSGARESYLNGVDLGQALGLTTAFPLALKTAGHLSIAGASQATGAAWPQLLGCVAGVAGRHLGRIGRADDSPAWSRVWCGVLDLHDPQPPASALETTEGVPYDSARFLVRDSGRTLGFTTLPLQQGVVSQEALRSTIAEQFGPMPRPRSSDPLDDRRETAATVAVCTRNRARTLGRCLQALTRLQHERLDILIVDNAPSDDSTRTLVQRFAANDSRIRYARELAPGLSRARNCAIRESSSDLLAFTDDDVIVDEAWLRALMVGFDRSPQVGCVTGLVASASLETAAEQYFDQRVWWSSRLAPRIFTRHPEPGDPGAYPFTTGIMGTGANLAFRRDALIDIGGFDEALGAGAPTAGGEDIDIFARLLLANYAISYEPDAVVWHEHRIDDEAARRQLHGYGKGLAAYLVKYLTAPTTRIPLTRRLGASAAHALTLTRRARGAQTAARTPRGFATAELAGLLAGPLAYLRARQAQPADRRAAVQPR